MPDFEDLEEGGRLRPNVSHPFGRPPVTLWNSVMACLSPLWTLLQDFLATPRGPSTIQFKGRTYKILKKLGEGGFSFAYLVREEGHYGEPLALKQIRIQLPEQAERLQREIAAHVAVASCPHVIQLLDSQTVRDSAGRITQGLLLFPFYSRGTLQDCIDRIPPGEFLPISQILRITIGICHGLQAFHSLSPPLAFRDLKPANILLNDNGDPILMDFGSVSQAKVILQSRKDAIALQDLCAETVTAPYRAPELFDPPSQGIISESSDVWALGCTIYAMAFHESPFDGSMTAAVSGQVKFPTRRNPYDGQFCSFLEQCLQSNPKNRPTVSQIHDWCENRLSLLPSSNLSYNS